VAFSFKPRAFGEAAARTRFGPAAALIQQRQTGHPSTFVKFHWKPRQGLQSVVWNEAVKINGADPDFHRRDLWDAINGGDFPEWDLGVQLFDDAFADSFEVVAPKIAGATLSDGTTVAARHKIDGGPSVLFDAVAVIVSAAGAALLSRDAAARDFVTDAFAHCKYIGIGAEAEAIFVAAGIAEDLDEACLPLGRPGQAATFIEACRGLRYWPRELTVDLDARPEA